MFQLDPACRSQKILGCGDGPASFNAEMTAQGGSVISFDPLYAFAGPEIKRRFEETAETVISQVRATPEKWVWTFHRDPDELLARRIEALDRFLADYETGKAARRYVTAEFPALPFADQQFDLALCSHFLFLYSNLFSEDFHVRSIQEMCRVATDIRIFPILTLEQTPSPHLSAVRQAAEVLGFASEISRVEYGLQRNGNQMLRLFKKP